MGTYPPQAMKTNRREKSIAQITKEYIEGHPSIRDCIRYDIVNFSALSRKIMDEMEIRNEEAVLVACRRYAEERRHPVREAEIRDVLKNSRIEMRTKISIVTARNDWLVLANLENAVKGLLTKKTILQVIQGANAITIITDEDIADRVAGIIGKENVLKTRRDLAEVVLRSPEKIAETSGVLSFLLSSLSERGVNAVEVVSCYTDSIFIVEEKDMMKAYNILSGCIKG